MKIRFTFSSSLILLCTITLVSISDIQGATLQPIFNRTTIPTQVISSPATTTPISSTINKVEVPSITTIAAPVTSANNALSTSVSNTPTPASQPTYNTTKTMPPANPTIANSPIILNTIPRPVDTTTAIQKIDTYGNPLTDKKDILFSFDYTDKDLVDLINHFAALTNNNIILPQGNPIKEKVTLHLREKISLDQAWNSLLPTILDIAGYSINQKENTYTVIKNTDDISREPMPLYIGMPPEKLPNTDQRIRYLYYLANIKISANGIQDFLKAVLTSVLPKGAVYETDASTNAIILCAKSNDVRNAMKLIMQLDQTDFQETMEIVHLKYTTADTVAAIFNEGILKPAQERDRYRLDVRKEPRDTYFSETTKIIPEPKSNSLILLGRPQSIGRIKEFIYNHIDVELESGDSVLHVYKLQYLDAHDLAPILMEIVKQQRSGGTGQSRAGQGGPTGGTERFFEDVLIIDDKIGGGKGEGTPHYGGNKLVIAARNDDWLQIKKLIEKLDIPQPQVLIEVLIADLTLSDARELGAMTRNPDRIPLPCGVNFQSAQFANIIVGPDNINPQSIKADLLRNDSFTSSSAAVIESNNAAANATLLNAGASTVDTPLTPNLLPSDTAGILPVTDSTLAANQSLFPSADPNSVLNNSISPATNNDIGALVLPNNAAEIPAPGATVISLNDSNGRTWSLLQILNSFTNSKILAHPHIIAVNNKPSSIIVGEDRLLPDAASGSTGGAATQVYKHIEANLEINITPRISAANLVNLQINIDINHFIDPGINTRIKRHFDTNANVADGSILALGGLIKKINSTTQRETPVLGRIPIIGWLFKNRTGSMEETNLTVFILPTIIQPRLRPGISKYTEDYVSLAQQYSQEGELFSGIKDPITRWYFKPEVRAENVLNNFLVKDEFKLDFATAESSYEPTNVESKKDILENITTLQSMELVRNKKDTPESTHKIDDQKNITQTTDIVHNEKNSSKNKNLAQHKQKQDQHLKELLKDAPNPFLGAPGGTTTASNTGNIHKANA